MFLNKEYLAFTNHACVPQLETDQPTAVLSSTDKTRTEKKSEQLIKVENVLARKNKIWRLIWNETD